MARTRRCSATLTRRQRNKTVGRRRAFRKPPDAPSGEGAACGGGARGGGGAPAVGDGAWRGGAAAAALALADVWRCLLDPKIDDGAAGQADPSRAGVTPGCLPFAADAEDGPQPLAHDALYPGYAPPHIAIAEAEEARRGHEAEADHDRVRDGQKIRMRRSMGGGMMNDAMAATLPSARKEEDYGPTAVSWKLAGVRTGRTDVLSWVKRSARLALPPPPRPPHAPRPAAATARRSSTLRRAAGLPPQYPSVDSTDHANPAGTRGGGEGARQRGAAVVTATTVASGGSSTSLRKNGRRSIGKSQRRPGVTGTAATDARPRPAQCAVDGGGENGGDKWDPDAGRIGTRGDAPAAPEPPPAPAPPPPPAPPAPPAPAPLMPRLGGARESVFQ